MNGVEELLRRDIAAVTGGVVVTESDLLDARRAVGGRVDRVGRRERLGRLALAGAAAVALVAAGATAFVLLGEDDDASSFAGPEEEVSDPYAGYFTGTAPTASLLAGLWRVDNGEVLMRFSTTGAVQLDNQGTIFSRPGITGTYAVGEDVITVTITSHVRAECVGTQHPMRAALPGPGELRFLRVEDSGTCSPLPVGYAVLEQLLPPSSFATELDFSGEPGWQPLSDRTLLLGVWLAEGAEHALEMAPDGTYVVADVTGEPVDTGQWSLRADDLVLTSSAASTACETGDRLVLGAVEWIEPFTTVIRGQVQENTCGGAWTPLAWVLLPHAGS